MPGTAYRLADEEPVGERRSIMGAKGAKREQLAVPPDQQDCFAIRMALQHRPFGQ